MELNRDTMKKLMLLILYTILLFALALRFEMAVSFLGWGLRLVFPFLLGAVIAFIINVPMRFVERWFPARSKWKRLLSLVLVLLFLLLILGIVFFMVVPQLTDTLISLGEQIPQFLAGVQDRLEEMFAQYPEVLEYINAIDFQIDWKNLLERVAGFVTTGAGTVLSSTLTAAASIASGITSFGIAFIFSIYILMQKENLARQLKKLCYAYFPEKAVNELIRISRMAEQIFSRFLAGQCTEALILGTMFFIVLNLFKMPYALLIGVLIAFTALIPIFGAFIGCVVGAFLTLMVSPIQAFWFLIIFFVLQQLEGNLIYPHVVGNSVGLPSIWVLAAVTIGGSMLGIPGMLLFIPLCSVLYALLREDVNRRLNQHKKGQRKVK